MKPASTPYLPVSHALCPYVQRVAIALQEKGLRFERRDVDLADKPDWFLALSPLGKTPVLQVEDAAGGPDRALFESSVICEYLEEAGPAERRLHPSDALDRARHRAWMEFASQLLAQIAALYRAADEDSLRAQGAALRQRLVQLEAELDPSGPYFAGADFALSDAAFAPVFRYFPALHRAGLVDASALLDPLPRLQAWSQALLARPSVKAAVAADYEAGLDAFLARQPSARVVQGLREPISAAREVPTLMPPAGS